MTSHSKHDRYALDADLLPDADHAALLAVGAKLMAAPLKSGQTKAEQEEEAGQTLYNYGYAHRCLLAVIAENCPDLLRERSVPARYTPETLSWFINLHEPRLSARSMATRLRDLVSFAVACAPSADLSFFRAQAQRFEAIAKRDGKHKTSYAIDRSQAPQLAGLYSRLEADGESPYTGDLSRYLGAQQAAGLNVATLDIAFLASAEAIANFERMIPQSESLQQRITTVGCMLRKAAPGLDLTLVSARASAIRKAASSHPGLYERRAVEIEELPEEVKERLKHATTYDGRLSFALNGKEISLAKAYRRDGKEFSPTHINAMRLALRRHYTILSAAGSPLAQDFLRWGEREAIEAFQAFYAEDDLITQTSRLEELIAALRAIYGDSDRKMFAHERQQVRLMNALRKRLTNDDELGFDLRAAGKIDASGAEAVDPPSTHSLRRRATQIALKALARLRDLKASPLAYRDVTRLAGLFRTAMLVAFLAEVPPRLRTVRALTKAHLRKPKPTPFGAAASGAMRYGLDVPGALTKTGQPFRHTCSLFLTWLLDAWFAEVRAVLQKDRPDAPEVFISDEGQVLSRSRFQTTLPKFTAAVFGFRIFPHLFRKLHGTELIGDREAAARRNQHGNLETQIFYQDGEALRDQDRSSSLQQDTEGFFLDFDL
jgi:uncharacterized protein YjhX (UPF0386 family)